MCRPDPGETRAAEVRGQHVHPQNCGSAGPGHGGQSRRAPGSVRHTSPYSFHPADREPRVWSTKLPSWRQPKLDLQFCGALPPGGAPLSDIPGAQTAPAGSACRLSGVYAPLCPRTLRKLPPRLSLERGGDWDRSPVPSSPRCIRSCGA